MVCAVALSFACDRMPGGGSDEQVVQLENGEVRLPAGARRHDVVISGVGGDAGFQPASIEASQGDVIVFEAGDALQHSIAFDAGGLSAAQDSFLHASAQQRSPPLLSRGARWVVSLEQAPAGSYTVLDLPHGARARLQVAPRQAGGS